MGLPANLKLCDFQMLTAAGVCYFIYIKAVILDHGVQFQNLVKFRCKIQNRVRAMRDRGHPDHQHDENHLILRKADGCLCWFCIGLFVASLILPHCTAKFLASVMCQSCFWNLPTTATLRSGDVSWNGCVNHLNSNMSIAHN